MARFEEDTYVKVIATGRIGKVFRSERKRVTVEFYDKSCINPELSEFKDNELVETKLPQMKMSQLKPFVRGEVSLTELTNGVHIIPKYVENDSEAYKVTTKDLLVGAKYYEKMTPEDILRWIDTVILFEDEMSFPSVSMVYIQDAVTEEDFLSYVHDEIEELLWSLWDGEFKEVSRDNLKIIRAQLEKWINSNGKEYPEEIREIIAVQYDNCDIDKQSEATQKLFKECLDYCCDVKRDPKAIQRRGYCYYCGTNIYPNNWYKARDAFIDYYQMTGDASAANTLGYIYYYGRCNGGVPEYDEAFKYFSIGHASLYFESTYKLADMFANGYGVVKDGKSASYLYWKVYKENLGRFIRGDFEGKFADAALRMGNCFKDGIGVDENLKTAYYYYLQADYAIRERIKAANIYGDTVVFNGIQKALAEVRKYYSEKGRTEQFAYPNWTKWALVENRRCKLVIKELKDGALALDATVLKRRDEEEALQMLITVPKADYCELRKKIHIKTAPNSCYEIVSEKPEIVFDSIKYDWEKSMTYFYLYDDLVGVISTSYYTFTVLAKKQIAKTGDVYHFVSVRFEESGRCYDYLCDDKSVIEGDFVVVNGYDGEKTVKVVSVMDKYESELGLPIERYKKVVKKLIGTE